MQQNAWRQNVPILEPNGPVQCAWRQVAPAPPAVDLAGVVPVAAGRLDPLAPSKAAGLQAVIEALRYVQSPGYPDALQALLHVSDGAAARLAAGVWNPEGGKELVESVRLELPVRRLYFRFCLC